jgi:hypothetical protein
MAGGKFRGLGRSPVFKSAKIAPLQNYVGAQFIAM